MKYTLCVLLISLGLTGCSLAQQDSDRSVNIHMILESRESYNGRASVYLEGPDGNYLTGSRVMIENSGGAVNLLHFDIDAGCYEGEIPYSADGHYTVLVDGTLLDTPYSKTIDHYVLRESPDITLLQDSSGASALSGESLGTGNEIRLSWKKSSQATVYQICLYKNGSLVHLETSPENTAIIQGEVLSGEGNYSCQIKAQYIGGDPLLRNQNYYSYSEKGGSSLYFSEE